MANSVFDSVAQHDRVLSYQDFIPQERKKNEYETLEDLIVKANKWLESNPDFYVKSCETYNIKVHKEGPDQERMSYLRKGQDEDSFSLTGRNYYLRCLRLWLIPQFSSRKSDHIGCKTYVPIREEVDQSKILLLRELLMEINDSFRMKPVEGQIIAVETKPVKFTKASKFKPSKSNWSEATDERKSFMFVIRIFFLYTSITVENIEFKDFSAEIPATSSGAINFSTLKLSESLSRVYDKAKDWIDCNSNTYRICNIHTIDIKVKLAEFLENREIMSYTEHNERATFYWRAIRVVCLTSAQGGGVPRPITFSYKSFIPVLLTSHGNFESMTESFARVHAWLSLVKRNGHISIQSVETQAIRYNCGGEKVNGADTSWTVYKGGRNERWIYIIKVYFDGNFTEPPPNSLPYVPPVLHKSTCEIQ